MGQLAVWLLYAAGFGVKHAGPPGSLAGLVALHLAGLVQQSGKLWTMLAGGTVLMLLGLFDDRRGLDWRLRLGVQTAVAVALVALGWRMSLFIDMPWLTGALSVLWIVGLVNSFNMLDNMDGLSAGVAAIAAAMLAVVMLTAPARQQPAAVVRRRLAAGDRRLAVGVPRGTTGRRPGCSWATPAATWSATCWRWPR